MRAPPTAPSQTVIKPPRICPDITRPGLLRSGPRCEYPHYRVDGQAVYGDEKGAKDPNISHSWIVSESVTKASGSYGGLHALWSVPPTPPSNDGQTLFYFPGLEDINDVVTIIQPVLGWNSDFASAWGIASWNCCENGTTYEARRSRSVPEILSLAICLTPALREQFPVARGTSLPGICKTASSLSC